MTPKEEALKLIEYLDSDESYDYEKQIRLDKLTCVLALGEDSAIHDLSSVDMCLLLPLPEGWAWRIDTPFAGLKGDKYIVRPINRDGKLSGLSLADGKAFRDLALAILWYYWKMWG